MTDEERLADWQIQKDIEDIDIKLGITEGDKYNLRKNKKEGKKYIPTSKIVFNNDLLEQVYIPDKKQTYFLRWDKAGQQTIIMNEVEEGDTVYKPINDKLLHDQVVILPEKAEEYKSIEDLEIEIEAFIETWLEISKDHLKQATLYVMLTWVADKLHTIPYLRALGDYGTGKTRYLDVIGGICYKPMYVGGAVRSAPIYRVIDKWRGTAIFDEFTLNKSDESEHIIQILNNGFERGKPVLRCKEGNYDVESFDPFGAKILASRRGFADKALESRCITEKMGQTNRTDIPYTLTSHFYTARKELQNKLLMYRFRNWDEIQPDEIVNIDFGDILPRIKQALIPFTVLFTNNEEKLQQFKKYARNINDKIIEENSQTMDGYIVNKYLQLKINLEPIITAQEIRNGIVNDGDWKDTLNSRTVGRHLKVLGFESNPKKWNNKTVREVNIEENKLEILKRRYVLELPDENPDQTRLE